MMLLAELILLFKSFVILYIYIILFKDISYFHKNMSTAVFNTDNNRNVS